MERMMKEEVGETLTIHNHPMIMVWCTSRDIYQWEIEDYEEEIMKLRKRQIETEEE
jgi:hypothetical protein